MAFIELKWRMSQGDAFVCSLLVFLCLHTAAGMSGWGECMVGQDVSTQIREKSLSGEVVAELLTDTTAEGVHWILDGKDARWFYLDGRNLRLNMSAQNVIDRQVLGPILKADLVCYEEDILQSVYKITVEILDESDDSLVFAENTTHSVIISELTPVDTVVFHVPAGDKDKDRLMYSIDQTSLDAEYFKIDLPNTGEVLLSKPLDYERKPVLTVTVHALDTSTAEVFNTSITIKVLDGDDQYPQFLPCAMIFPDEVNHVCTSPVYTVNVTEGEEDIVLDFSPGPIHAVDGDTGINSPISYTIISGHNDGHFLMDRETGEVRLIQGVKDRLTTPMLHLQVMAYQADDSRKYTVATVIVHIQAVNQFRPEFDMAEYHGFVSAGNSAASLVNTYGSKALMLQVQDLDFKDGFNPMIHFTFSPTSNHSDIYYVTQEGLVIAKTSQLKPKQKHNLEVMAVDQESGDATFATVLVEVLPEGHSIPQSPQGGTLLTGCVIGKVMFLIILCTLLMGCLISPMLWLKRRHLGHKGSLNRGCVAQEKHPNVTLQWFQLVNHHSAMAQMEELPFGTDEYGTCNPSFSLHDKSGINNEQDCTPCGSSVPPRATALTDTHVIPTETVCSPVIMNNNSTPIKSSFTTHTFHSTTADVNPCQVAQESSLFKESPPLPSPPRDSALDSESSKSLTPSKTNHSPTFRDITSTQPFTCQDSKTTPTDSSDDYTDPINSPSSQSSFSDLFSHSRIALAEIEKPFCKPCVNTPNILCSPRQVVLPLESSPFSKETRTPPPTPEHAPLKGRLLVHIDTSSLAKPLTPQATYLPLRAESFCQVDQPCTSMDKTDPLEKPGKAANMDSPYEDKTLSLNSEYTQEVGEDVQRDEDADNEDELDSDDEALLSTMNKCNPIFISFCK
ncbi:uncharacterized protein LOC117514922 [Thalassophryne amazonica]|uniref:uncharacterized protein LOC117514922 n=1 Tax=Thalassophryne amazonica TaxID=390379 RepID=UPI0014715EB4|nr:uncharacterized protein LOC117514922 [Thalassophryne amazonica]